MSENVATAEPVAELPATLSGRLEQLAQGRTATSPLRRDLDTAVEDALELESDLERAEAKAKRVAPLEAELADARAAATELHDQVEALEARIVEVDNWRTDAEEELNSAKLEAAAMAAEVQRLETTPLGRRRAAWEAAAGERTPADTFGAVLAAARWIADGEASSEEGGE